MEYDCGVNVLLCGTGECVVLKVRRRRQEVDVCHLQEYQVSNGVLKRMTKGVLVTLICYDTGQYRATFTELS